MRGYLEAGPAQYGRERGVQGGADALDLGAEMQVGLAGMGGDDRPDRRPGVPLDRHAAIVAA